MSVITGGTATVLMGFSMSFVRRSDMVGGERALAVTKEVSQQRNSHALGAKEHRATLC